MKRLLDEDTDELTRSLLVAGIEHRPPAGNKGQVLVALGAGGALGLFSSNAFAWLGTTAGKVTAVGVAVGVAGAVFAAAVPGSALRSDAPSDGRVAAHPSAITAPDVLPEAALPQAAPPQAALPQGVPGAGEAPNTPESAAAGAAEPGDLAGAVASGQPSASGEPSVAPARGHEARARAAAARKAARKKSVASKSSELRRDGPLPAEAPPAVESEDGDGARADTVALDAEVRLVDDMHAAARRNDRDALARLLETYRATFPDGQLKKEVEEFAARLERSGSL